MGRFPVVRVALASLILVAAAPSHAWTIKYDLDNTPPGASCGWSDGSGATVSSEQYSSATHSCKLSITAGDTGFGRWGGVYGFPSPLIKGGEIWFRLRTFMPVGFNYDSTGEGSHLKFLRIHTQTPAGSNRGYDDLYINPSTAKDHQFKFIYEGEQVWSYIGSMNADRIRLGVWETYEYYVKLDTVPMASGGQAHVRVWKNGTLIADIKDRKTLDAADLISDRAHLFTYWNGGSPATQSMYVDDLVITTDVPASRDASDFPFIGLVQGDAPNPPTEVSAQ